MRDMSGCTPGGRTAASPLLSWFFSLKKPGSAGSSSSQSCANQAGWVKSPVATTSMPLTAAQAAKPCKLLDLLVARE